MMQQQRSSQGLGSGRLAEQRLRAEDGAGPAATQLWHPRLSSAVGAGV